MSFKSLIFLRFLILSLLILTLSEFLIPLVWAQSDAPPAPQWRFEKDPAGEHHVREVNEQNPCVAEEGAPFTVKGFFFGYQNHDDKTTRTAALDFVIKKDLKRSFVTALTVESNTKLTKWRETQQLPASSKITIGEGYLYSYISPDNKMVIIEDSFDNRSKTIESIWDFLPEDPFGFYRLTYQIDGKQVCDFKFEVR